VSLISQSFNWIEKVQAPVNGLTHQPTKTFLADRWEGPAASAYTARAAAQNDAIGAVSTKADGVSKWLMDIAKRFAEALSKVRDIMSMMTDGKLSERGWPQAVNG
jgi:uncharacterized protein YukE